MTNHGKRAAVAIATAVLLIGNTGCDDASSLLDPAFSWIGDPPKLALIADGRLIAVEFNWFGTGYRVRPIAGAVVPAGTSRLPGSARMAANGRAGGSLFDLPDLDAHEFDSTDYELPPLDDLPDPLDGPPDDYPIPELPDIPDTFDGLDPAIEPPLDDTFFTNLDDGTLTTTTGPIQTPGTTSPPGNFTGSDGRTAASTKINIGGNPAGMVKTRDGRRILVAYSLGIAVVDRRSKTVIDRISLPPGSVPYSIAVTPDGRTAYVSSVAPNAEFYAVDLVSRKVVATLSSGGYASSVAMKPDGTQVWFTSFLDDSVTVVDVVRNTLGVKIGSILNAWAVRFHPTGTRAYVSGPTGSGDVVSVIDTSTYTVIAKIPVGFSPRSMIVTPSGRHLFVANYGGDTITQIDTATNKVVRNITVGKKPHGFQVLR